MTNPNNFYANLLYFKRKISFSRSECLSVLKFGYFLLFSVKKKIISYIQRDHIIFNCNFLRVRIRETSGRL